MTGSSLAQDRGRLESKIEAQSSEIVTLKKNMEVSVSRGTTLSILILLKRDNSVSFNVLHTSRMYMKLELLCIEMFISFPKH
jgi:hypothetical protein